ncbi:penicillin acylase family protein [Urechidicola sp. KH5]
MKYLKLITTLVLASVVFYVLNTKFGSIPPIGKFLDPVQGVWQNETDDQLDGQIAIPNLKAEVTVHYDKALIPHIFAQNREDLYKAQGYITAKHRLWQMEFQTHAAAGRLSEIVGEAAINYDRGERRRGMVFAAENVLKKMEDDPDGLAYLEAYADGVNAYINSLEQKDLPVEYKLLDYQPEAWTSKKTALLLMYMTKMLATGDDDLEYTNILRKFGKERFDLLFPDFFDINDPVIPKETDWSFIDTPITATPSSEVPLDTIVETIAKPHPDNGSNNWAVSAAKSTTGNPILANDPHLGLNLPSIWFVVQLSTPDHTVMGATLPGALGVISGFNQHISWGVTNAKRDVLDWYKITFNEDRTQYKHNNQWKAIETRVEEITVRNGATVLDTVLYTHHGPVTYDLNFKGDNPRAGYAMKWIGHLGGNNQRTFLNLNTSKNYDDYVEALSHYTAPAQNFVFASTEKDIALWVQGKFPNKWKGQGKFLMDGSNPEHDWQSFIPQPFNAHVKNPERGFVSSANQHPAGEDYPFYVFNDGYEMYRNRVINDFFRSKEQFSVADFKELHNNNYNLKAAELLPEMFKTLDQADLTEAEKTIYQEVRNWDFFNEIDVVGPSIWRAWWEQLYPMIWDELYNAEEAVTTPSSYQTIYLLIHHPEDAFMDILETDTIETAPDLFLAAFKKAVEKLQAFKKANGNYLWKDYKGTSVEHLLQGLPAFSRFNVPVGGDASIVNATSERHGASWRMIVEMSSPPKALGIYPGGQSGNPGSAYYDNYINDWAAGEYLELNFMQSVNETNAVMATQTLTPSSHE